MATSLIQQPRVWLRILLVLVLVGGIGLWVRSLTQGATVVRVAKVTRQGLIASTSTNGIVEPVHEFEVHSPLPTVITAIYVKEGEHVDQGKLLLTLDDASAKSTLAQAAASVKAAEVALASLQQGGTRSDQLTLNSRTMESQAERDAAARDLATLQRLEKQGAASPAEVQVAQQRLQTATSTLELNQLHKKDNYSSLDLSHAQSAVEEAKAAYAAAEDTLRQTEVHAPFAGTVFSLPVHATQFVQVGDKLLELADLSKLQVRAYFDEPELGKVALGQPATLTWAAKPGHTWHGTVTQMPSTIVHYGTRNVGEVVISVDDAQGILLPATNVTVTVTTTQRANALTVPREALHLDVHGNYVYVIQNDHLHRVDVTTGAVNMSEAEITGGLQEGATVVLSSVDGSPLKDGLEIRTADAN
jgi:HlyD family secretion protein